MFVKAALNLFPFVGLIKLFEFEFAFCHVSKRSVNKAFVEALTGGKRATFKTCLHVSPLQHRQCKTMSQ